MPATKATRTVKSAIERPNDPVAECNARNGRKYLVNDEVQWCKGTVLDVVANLPADVPSRFGNVYDARNNGLVFLAEVVYRSTCIIALAKAVWR